MWYWLHHLINPHCPDCTREKFCKSCDTLTEQLVYERERNQSLLNHIVALTAKPTESAAPVVPQIPVGKMTTWRTHRQFLEENDRETARLLRDSQRQSAEISKLEKELGIPDSQQEEIKNAETVGGSS